jgi:hypothetical protein
MRWRIVIGRPRTRRYARGHGAQDLYRFGSPRWRALRSVWEIKCGALRLVLVEIRLSGWVPCRPLYSPGGGFLVGYKAGVLVGLHGTSPSRITGEF